MLNLGCGETGGHESLEGRCKATWQREFKLPWREAGPPNYLNDTIDSDQLVVNKELSLTTTRVQLQNSEAGMCRATSLIRNAFT